MNKKVFILSISILIYLINAGCENSTFFELENPPATPWSNVEEFEKAAVGTYWAAFRRSQWSNLIGSPRLLKTVQSDIVQLLPGTIGDIPFNEMYLRESEKEISNATGIFRNCYRVINTANSAIQFLHDHDRSPFENLTQNEIVNLRRIEGELHFMRGYAYWTLATVFMPIYGINNNAAYLPLRTTFEEKINEIKNPKIGTVEEIYNLIKSDFELAKSLLPKRYESGVHHPSYAYGRANAFAASAMLAKVNIMMQDNDAALNELNFIIEENGGDYTLDQDPIEAFNRDDETRGNEVIFYALYYDPISDVNAYELTSMTLQSYNATNGGNEWPNGFVRITWNQFAFSYSVLKQIGWMSDPENGDFTVTEEALNDKRYNQLYRLLEGYNGTEGADPSKFETVYGSITNPVVWCDKYFRGKDHGKLTNIPIIRLAEIHLTRALLRYRMGNVQGATEDINIVRQRAGLESIEPSSLTEDTIHNERIKELAFEGDRLDYLRASRLSIPGGDRPNALALPPDSPSFVWKIPQREIDLNTNL